MRHNRPTEAILGTKPPEGSQQLVCTAGRRMAGALAKWSVDGGPAARQIVGSH